jgi:hypothetical protein
MPTDRSKDRLSKAEIRKDALQESVTAASHAVGSVATIITGAVGDIARTLGGFATELFEIRDSVRRAGRDHELHDDVVVTVEAEKPTARGTD